jgi:hypothetical protein
MTYLLQRLEWKRNTDYIQTVSVTLVDLEVKGKTEKFYLFTSRRHKGSRYTDPLLNKLCTRWTWEISLTYRPLYPPRRNSRGTHRTGGNLGLRDCLEILETINNSFPQSLIYFTEIKLIHTVNQITFSLNSVFFSCIITLKHRDCHT